MPSAQHPLLSVTFPTMDRKEMVQSVIANIRRDLHDIPYEIVIVVGKSNDGTLRYLQAQEDVIVVEELHPQGCRQAFDLGFRACTGEFVCWINDDVAISPNALRTMLDFMRAPENADVGMGAFAVSTSADEPTHFVLNCYEFPPIPYADMGMLRRELLERIGYLDSRYRRFGWDPDLSLKVWDLGLRVRLCPEATIIHYFHDDSNRRSMEFLRKEDADRLGDVWKSKILTLARRAWTPRMREESWPYLLPIFRAQLSLFLEDTECLMAVLREAEDLPGLLDNLYHIGLNAHRADDLATAGQAYRAVCAFGENNPEVAAWAHFKLGELLRGTGEEALAREHWRQALRFKPNLEKARVHLADPDAPLCVGFGADDGAPEAYLRLSARPDDDFTWDYLFECRKPDSVYFGPDVLDDMADSLSNALRHIQKRGTILSVAAAGPLSAEVEEIRERTQAYASEFTRWREALKCGWLLAKGPKKLNERDVEWPWVLQRAAAARASGRLLDVGSYHTPLPGKFASLGFTVTALDINPPITGDDTVRVIQGDIRATSLPDGSFDAISCVSTLEHIGVPGRYGVRQADNDGDFTAMAEMVRLLAPGGVIWITVPVGCRDVLPINRCYDKDRLRRLFAGVTVREAAYRVVGKDGIWRACSEEEATAVDWHAAPWYALGLFELETDETVCAE